MATLAIDIGAYLELQAEVVEKKLNQLLPEKSGPYEKLFEASRYAVLGSGKRLRPILTLATTQLLKGNVEYSLKPACTLEIIHSSSLIHDDLPCMDNDDFRRGKPSLHRQYREGHAVLTGDFLLTYAFETLATDSNLLPETRIELIKILSQASGADGMIGGQVLDLAYENKKIPLETLCLLQKNKTAALITAAVEFGGVLSFASPSQLNILRKFGENIGLAFQIVDDILDITSSEIKHGRSVGSDILNDKATFVSLIGMEESKRYALQLHREALSLLKHLDCDTSILEGIANFILERNY